MKQISTCPICDSANSSEFLKAKDYTVSNETFTIVECSDCTFRYTNPIPEEENIGEYYKSEDYISHSGTKKGIVPKIYHQVRKITLKRKRNLVNKHSNGKKVLDIGCGTGDFANFMNTNGFQTTGLEPDEDTRNFAINTNNVNAFPIEKLHQFEEKSFDAITMWHVLEHVYDLQKDVEQMSKLIKEDGAIYVAVPNCASADAEKYGEFWAAYDLPIHLYHFRADDVRNLFGKFGMEVTEVIPMNFDAFWNSMWSEKYIAGNTGFSLKSMVKGFFSGLSSNRKAGKEGSSSLTYVIKRKK